MDKLQIDSTKPILRLTQRAFRRIDFSVYRGQYLSDKEID